MSMAAAGQLGKNSREETDDVSTIMSSILEKGESVEIVALSEELSAKEAQILDQRRKQSNPVTAYMKNIQCETNGEVDAHDEPLSGEKSRLDPGSPIWRLLVSTMPIISWMPRLDWRTIRADVIAGLTVGVMVIPQSMSYANIAGLKYIYGMYSACVPTFFYAFFGQSRQLAVGPVAMVSLLVEAGLRDKIPISMARSETCKAWFDGNPDGLEQYVACPDEYAELAFLVSVAVGVMQIAGSILKLGFLVSFLGHPVTSGFTSGAAIIIGLSQVKDWLGFKIPKSQYVYETIAEMIKGIDKTKPLTLFLGILWLAFLFTNKKLSAKHKKFRMMGPLGPLISCVVAILLVWLVEPLREDFDVAYVGSIPDGLFPVSIGKLDFSLLPDILPTALSACLIGYMESVAIGKNLAAKHGYEIDAGQEMMALGISNLVGGCFSCYPVTGSFSRSAVMNSTGGLTQLGGLISSLLMFCTLMFLTNLFWFLPKFALASIVINSIIPLVAFGEAKKLYRIKRNDFVLWVVAFIGTMVLGVLLGILFAVGLSLTIVIYESVRPQITILWRIPGTSIYRNVKQESSGTFIKNVFICRIGSSLYFANAAYVKDMLLAYTSDVSHVNKTEYLILEMTSVVSIDSTAVHVIQDIVSEFRSRNIQVAFAMVGNRVEKTMRKAKLTTAVGQQWFFPTVNDAVQYCLRHQHAKQTQNSQLACLSDLQVGTTQVHIGNEIGISNSMNDGCTTVFITLVKDIPGIMADIACLFKMSNVSIIRAQIDTFMEAGAKHTYLLKGKKDGPLSDIEIERAREDLESLINSSVRGNKVISRLGKSDSIDDGSHLPALQELESTAIASNGNSRLDRISRLEDTMFKEHESNRQIKLQLEAQNKRLDMLISMNSPEKSTGAKPQTVETDCLADAQMTL